MVHVRRGFRLEHSRSLVISALLAVPLWITSCTDGDDDDAGANGARAGMTAAAGSAGSGGATSAAGAGATGHAGSQSAGAGSGKGGTSSGAGGPSTAGTSSVAGGGSGGGNGGMTTTSGGAGTGGTTSAGAGSGGTAGSDAGMSGDAGTSGRAGTGGGSSIGGRGPMPGFECGEITCAPGQTCVSCTVGVTPTYETRCTPDQEEDPDGYAQAIKECQTVSGGARCDGPEDCPPDEHCVYTMESRGQPVCEPEPVVGLGANCCFSCDSFAVCTLCWSDADCPETYICVRSGGQPPDGPGGCRLAE